MSAKCECCDEVYGDERIGTVCRVCGRGMISGDMGADQYRDNDEIGEYIERLNTDWQADIIEIDPAEYRGNDYGEE